MTETYTKNQNGDLEIEKVNVMTKTRAEIQTDLDNLDSKILEAQNHIIALQDNRKIIQARMDVLLVK